MILFCFEYSRYGVMGKDVPQTWFRCPASIHEEVYIYWLGEESNYTPAYKGRLSEFL